MWRGAERDYGVASGATGNPRSYSSTPCERPWDRSVLENLYLSRAARLDFASAGGLMVANVAHLIARDAASERIRALVRTTVSEIESSFTTVDRLQSRTRLALTLSLLEDGTQSSPRFDRPTAGLRAELNKLDVDDRHYWIRLLVVAESHSSSLPVPSNFYSRL